MAVHKDETKTTPANPTTVRNGDAMGYRDAPTVIFRQVDPELGESAPVDFPAQVVPPRKVVAVVLDETGPAAQKLADVLLKDGPKDLVWGTADEQEKDAE